MNERERERAAGRMKGRREGGREGGREDRHLKWVQGQRKERKGDEQGRRGSCKGERWRHVITSPKVE